MKRFIQTVCSISMIFVSRLWRKKFRNIEGRTEYNVVLPKRRLEAGVTAMLRAKNEEEIIVESIDSIIDVFDEIVFIDNDSDDRTVELVHAYRDQSALGDRIKIFSYPFSVARCGEEHQSTDANSLNSLVYYYNYCLSLCNRKYVFKWDADMILSKERREDFRSTVREIVDGSPKVLNPRIQTVYKVEDGSYYEGVGQINEEARLFPNASIFYYFKGLDWEQLKSYKWFSKSTPIEAAIYEVKNANFKEFSHWSSLDIDDPRISKEIESVNKLSSGLSPEGFKKIGSNLT